MKPKTMWAVFKGERLIDGSIRNLRRDSIEHIEDTTGLTWRECRQVFLNLSLRKVIITEASREG